jgi:hypothetical protein
MTTPEDSAEAAAADKTTVAQPATATPPIAPVVSLHQAPDANLSAIARASYFLGFPVTLYMPWGVASGNTAPYNDYYRYLAELTRNVKLPPDVPEDSADVIDQFAKNNFDPYAEVPYSESAAATIKDGFDLTSFINLKDALCWIGGFPEPFRHDYLRLRLTDVTAWAWGSLR